MLQAGLRLGISTNNETELQRALSIRPSYIALSHIFSTQSKKMSYPPQGLEALRRQCSMLPSDMPSVAIGGMNIERVPAVLACGVGGIAVISAITQASNWQQATRDLLKRIADADHTVL